MSGHSNRLAMVIWSGHGRAGGLWGAIDGNRVTGCGGCGAGGGGKAIGGGNTTSFGRLRNNRSRLSNLRNPGCRRPLW
uniref:Uncharacterized protein n=1 Tax=Romanomermis culicivorax TaxID=13658 RepID=A0A915L378_ROMCU